MNTDEFFKLVPASQFFKTYAPDVKMFYHKMRGKDGNKKPISWTPQDRENIRAGIKRLTADLKKTKF